MKKQTILSGMKDGQKGTVVSVQGGIGLVKRLDGLGIRPGKEITKTSGPFMRGPVTLRVGNAQVAIGFGMAQKILVEVEGKSTK
jgi:ferrous iron transport protein A